jgi:hypothetical protein
MSGWSEADPQQPADHYAPRSTALRPDTFIRNPAAPRFTLMNRRRIAELLATLIVIGMWVAISVEVSNEMSPAPEQATVEVAATP